MMRPVTEHPGLLRQLLKVVLAYTWFFETVDDDVLDDDTALEQTEYAAHLLNRLPAPDRDHLLAELAALAAQDPDPASRAFTESFAFAMGLVEDPPPSPE